MNTISFQVTVNDRGHQRKEIVSVHARNINSGFAKALIFARHMCDSCAEIICIEFWERK